MDVSCFATNLFICVIRLNYNAKKKKLGTWKSLCVIRNFVLTEFVLTSRHCTMLSSSSLTHSFKGEIERVSLGLLFLRRKNSTWGTGEGVLSA